MTEHGIELEGPRSLTEQVMATCQEAYMVLRGMLDELPYEGSRDNSVEAGVLAREVGVFVAANTCTPQSIAEIPRAPELTAAADQWLELRLQRMLKSAMFSAVLQQKEAEIKELLEGRQIRAKSLAGPFGAYDGTGITWSANNPSEIVGPFLTAEPAQGAIWVGEPSHAFKVSLFSMQDPNIVAAEIEVQ